MLGRRFLWRLSWLSGSVSGFRRGAADRLSRPQVAAASSAAALRASGRTSLASTASMAGGTKVVVVGAGIIGLSTAYRLVTELKGVQVTVVADKFTPDTTGDGAAGLWEPYIAGENSREELMRWCSGTWNHLDGISKSEDGHKRGVFPISGYSFLVKRPEERPFWAEIVKNFRVLSDAELEEFSVFDAGYGSFFTTFICEGRKYIPGLQERFVQAGGILQGPRKLLSLDEVAGECDIIVNCTGLGAAELVGDQTVHPVRGHILRVDAPCLKMFYVVDNQGLSDEMAYIIPNSDNVVLGGTRQKNNWNVENIPEEGQAIVERCSALFPSIQHANIIERWTGLRPARFKVRLECSDLQTTDKTIKVVHNYGHGGSGLTMFWGCAGDVVGIVQQIINPA